MNIRSKIKLRTGRGIPVFGLGTWELTDDTAGTVASALEMGYPLIDTSGDYGTQPGIGEALKKRAAPRSSVYIVTKVEETDNAYEATKKNLGELGLEYADLVLIHRPPETDGESEELWRGLMRAREEGFAKDIGVSNYSIEKVDALIAATGEVPVVNQLEWSPFGQSDNMLRYAKDKEIIIMAYSPLTRGTRLEEERLRDMAAKYQKTPAQVLIRWNLERGTVPIPKANEKEHLKENIEVFDFELEKEDMEALARLNEKYSALEKLPYT